jgi:hypothetical protein
MGWLLQIVVLVGLVCLTVFGLWAAAKDFHRLTNWWEYDDDLPEDAEHK